MRRRSASHKHQPTMGALLSYLSSSGQDAMDDEDGDLLDLLNGDNIDWDVMIRRLRSYPEEAAAFAHSLDPSPFQRALEHPGMPLDVARAFLDAYEEAACRTNEAGESVLHAAVRHQEDVRIIELLLRHPPDAASLATREMQTLPLHCVPRNPQVAQILVEAYPVAAIAKDRGGRLPLHHACCCQTLPIVDGNADQNDNENITRLPLQSPVHPGVVKLLIRTAEKQGLAHGGVLVKDTKGFTPWSLLCADLSCMLEDETRLDEEARKKNTSDLWESLTFLAQTATACEGEEPDFRIVHSLISLDCSVSIVKHALYRYPNQFYLRDRYGRTPLMAAAVSLPKTRPSVLVFLLQSYPAAARMTGKLPIRTMQ